MDLPALLEKVIILHSHIEHQLFRKDDAELRKVARSLATFIQSGNYQLIRDAFIAATETEGRNIANVLRINRSLPRDIRDKAIANMLRTRPELAKAEEGDADGRRARVILIDRPGRDLHDDRRALSATRRSTRHLVNVRSRRTPPRSARPPRPATSRRTPSGRRRSSARRTYTRKSEELADELKRARVIEPSMQDGEHATVGSKVTLVQVDTERDASPTRCSVPGTPTRRRAIISYLSPIGLGDPRQARRRHLPARARGGPGDLPHRGARGRPLGRGGRMRAGA